MARFTTAFFDLFFTLITPDYQPGRAENDVMGMTVDQWERYAEDERLYLKRAAGDPLDPAQIISELCAALPFAVTDRQQQEILTLRQQRFRRAIESVPPGVLAALDGLRAKGVRLCLISNADAIDCMHWPGSPLSQRFDAAVFSCFHHVLKPDPRIYEIALRAMNATPEESIFIGDGGSDELRGAKQVGMAAVLSECLLNKNPEQRESIQRYADYSICCFEELIKLF